MKKLFLSAVLALLCCVSASAQQFVQSQTYTVSGAVAQASILENSNANVHTVTWTVAATVSACTVQLETSAAGVTFALMSGSVAQTCTSSGSYTFSGVAANFVRLNITALTISGGGSLVLNYSASSSPFAANFADGVWNVPLGACTLSVPTTGVFAANPASSGTFVGPAMVRVAAGETVLQATTTAAASAVVLDCDITPPSRLTTGKGVTLTGYQLWYAVQTTALTSITAPLVNSVTFPSTGGTAAGTVSTTAGGTLTVLPASLILTTSTSGACQSENVSFGTPIALNAANVRIGTTQVFNQTAASAEVIQICGLQVYYNNAPL